MFWNKNGTVINLNEINLEENEYQTRLKNFENITASIINPTLNPAHAHASLTDKKRPRKIKRNIVNL